MLESERKNQAIKNLIDTVRTHTTEVGLRFVDREVEIGRAVSNKYVKPNIPPNRVSVVFGGRGCGKTEFALALVEALSHFETYVPAYLRHVGRDLGLTIVYGSRDVVRVVRKHFEVVGHGESKLMVKGFLDGVSLMYYLANELEREGRKLIVFVDEFKGSVDSIRQSLEVEANDVGTLGFEWEKLIYLTSDVMAYELASLVGSKIGWFLMWNLPREDFEKLYMQINPPENISYDLALKLTGGNPRELIHLWRRYRWNIEEYVTDKIMEVAIYLETYFRGNPDFSEIEELVEDTEGAETFVRVV